MGLVGALGEGWNQFPISEFGLQSDGVVREEGASAAEDDVHGRGRSRDLREERRRRSRKNQLWGVGEEAGGGEGHGEAVVGEGGDGGGEEFGAADDYHAVVDFGDGDAHEGEVGGDSGDAVGFFDAEFGGVFDKAFALGEGVFGRFAGNVDLAETRKNQVLDVWEDKQGRRS